MASFEDYDEFGNYIGADLDSDEDEEEEEIPQQQHRQEAPTAAPLEGYDDVAMEDDNELALMQVDGRFCASSKYRWVRHSYCHQNHHITL